LSAGEPIIEASPSILRRKLRSEPASSQAQAVSPAKAARLSLARAADKAFELPMRVNAIRQSRLDLEDVVERFGDLSAGQ
jgi:flagellar motor switch protein FliM